MHEIITTDAMNLSFGTPDVGVSISHLYRIVVTVRGRAEMSLSARSVVMENKSALLIAPFELLYVSPNMSRDAEICCFTFASDMLAEQEKHLLTVFDGEPYRPASRLPEDLSTTLARISELDAVPRDMAMTFAKLYLTEILARLYMMPLPKEALTGVARAAEYLKEHLTEDITLDALSEEVGISKFYLCRAFSRDSGLTPHAYLNYLRAWRAWALLAGGMSAASVATAVGFSDYSTFFRTYRKMIGRSPTAVPCEAVK